MNHARQSSIATSHGTLAVEESGRGGVPLLFIHGNSSCRGVFRRQLQDTAIADRHLIAFDLPGHGQSSDAPDPERTYTRSGLADATAELLGRLGISDVVVLGWSLGGHVAIELLARLPQLRGLMITGTPPVGRGQMPLGFQMGPHMATAGKQDLSDAEIGSFLDGIFGASVEPFLRDAVRRSDGRFRKRLFESARAGDGVDQRVTVETSAVPIAVVNGSEDRLVRLEYIDGVPFGNLWEGKCYRLAGRGHAPFWEAPEEFNPILARFLRDIDSGESTVPSS